MVFLPHIKDSEYSLPSPACELCLETSSLLVFRSENQEKKVSVRKMQVFLMFSLLAGVSIVIAMVL
jgi:hypothetical protein